MNGTGRPCENSTTDTAILPLDYAFAQGMCLYPLRESFSAGLRRAKTTELRTTLCIARFARYAAFCIARFLARCMFSGHSARPLCLLPSLLAAALKLAYRELYERRGELAII